MRKNRLWSTWVSLGLALVLIACQPVAAPMTPESDTLFVSGSQAGLSESLPTPIAEPLPTSERPRYVPGELVDYVAQTGDTLPALAAHFNTSVEEILKANPFIPQTATTMPPGMPMKIPIYYAPFWGSAFQILPDGLFINGPAQIDFDVQQFVDSQPGWLKNHDEFVSGAQRTGAGVVQLVADSYSISPRLLLAILEYQSGALTNPIPPAGSPNYALGNTAPRYRGVYLQLAWAANILNNGYYGWRTGQLVTFDHQNSRIERPDPWQNAASVALHYYFSQSVPLTRYRQAIGPQGWIQSYSSLFGDPWVNPSPHISGSLEQPPMTLPFESGNPWALTGGPHTSWGDGAPLSALDFAPGSVEGGCSESAEWVTAVSPGVVARSEFGVIALDLDGDGDERTGWVVLYLHVASLDRAPLGAIVETGDYLGHPSCEGGRATGTHVHIARLYNGEWISAAGTLAFNLDGWVAYNGNAPYKGTLKRSTQTVIACDCSDAPSHIRADGPPQGR